MTTTDFLKAYPLPQSDPKTLRVFEQVERLHSILSTMNLNQRGTFQYTTDNARLDEVSKVSGVSVRKPDALIPHRHILLAHNSGMIILKGPEMRITETFTEVSEI